MRSFKKIIELIQFPAICGPGFMVSTIGVLQAKNISRYKVMSKQVLNSHSGCCNRNRRSSRVSIYKP